jgi:hypothetical protein
MNPSVKNLLKILFSFSCKKTEKSDGFDILGSSDETAEAGLIIAEANEYLTKIKVLYMENEGKREELKNAIKADDTKKVREISTEIFRLINDGTGFGKEATEKIQKAQEMNINAEYREYLRLKELSLTEQLKAFEYYHQAARSLRDNYDPDNKASREKINQEFKNHSENYRIIMEKASDYSKRANELAKESTKKQN